MPLEFRNVRASSLSIVVSAAAGAVGLLLAPSLARAFPMTDGAKANAEAGQPDFDTGFVPFSSDPLFGAQPASDTTMFATYDVAFDEVNDRLLVADLHNHRFLVFDVTGGVTADLAATLVLGQPDFQTGGADPDAPYGNANTTNARYGCTTSINACGVGRAWTVAYDPVHQRVFGADPDNDRVLVWEIGSQIENGQPASYVLGQPDFETATADSPCAGGQASAATPCGLDFPRDLHYDPESDRLFVADGDNHRVVVYDVAPGAIANGIAATAVLGQTTTTTAEPSSGCGGGDGATSACGLAQPSSITYDSARSRLFVADSGASRILAYDLGGSIENGMAAAAVLGQPDFGTATPNTSCGGGSSGDAETNACGLGIFGTRLAYNEIDDLLYAADISNHRVLAFDVARIDAGEPAIGVVGQPDFVSGYDATASGFGGATARDALMNPSGIAFDPIDDQLFVADSGNHRVIVFGDNVAGEPIDVEGGTSTSSENPDGSTTVDVASDDGDAFSVTFPPGTEAPEGEDEITITTRRSGRPSEQPEIVIEADLPPGETKSVSLSRGTFFDNPPPWVCVKDQSDATFRSGVCRDGGDRVRLPADGTCTVATVRGDPGDNPDDPSDPDGMHEIDVCVSADGESIELHRLLHTGIALLPAANEGPAAPPAPASGPSGAAVSGCRTAAGERGAPVGGAVLAAGLALAIARRRRASR